jgi:hypothetical protein
MNRDDIQKLLGGYATGTLTPEERQALFEAALTDQELFDALAREEALRDVLSDPAARAHLLAAIDNAPAPWYRQWWRPMVVVAAAVAAVVGVAVWEHSREPKPLTVAKVELPRFQPPAATAKPAPTLPPPPEVKRAVPAMNLPPLPAPNPVPPPRPTFAMPAAAPPPSPAQFPMAQSQQSQSQGQLQNSFLQQSPVPVRGHSHRCQRRGGPLSSSPGEVLGHWPDGENIHRRSRPIHRAATSWNHVLGHRVRTRIPNSHPARRGARNAGEPYTPGRRHRRFGGGDRRGCARANWKHDRPLLVPPSPAAVAKMKKAKSIAEPAIAYQLLRQVPGGDPVMVPADGTVAAGSVLILRVTPPADGYLRIVNGTRTLANPKARRGVTSETTLPPFDQPGRVELQVYFSRQAGEAKEQAPSRHHYLHRAVTASRNSRATRGASNCSTHAAPVPRQFGALFR